MTLNRAQRSIVRIGVGLVLFALLFPPLVQRGAATADCPTWFIFESQRPRWCKVDTMTLFLQTAAIVTGTTLLVWWFQPRQATATRPSETLHPRTIVQQLWRFLSSPWCLLLYLLLAVGLGIFAGLSRPEP